GEGVLVGYYVSRQEIGAGELGEWMRKEVGGEIAPGLYVQLKRMPLTLNGEGNYEGLPGIEEGRGRARQSYVGPGRTTESKGAGIWGEVIRLDKVGVNDNFFDLGGHSLLMVQVYTRIRETFDQDIPMVELFKYPTVKLLAARLDEHEAPAPV